MAITAFSQGKPDSAISKYDELNVIDTTLDYGQDFQDFEAFMDSILAPHNYSVASVSMTANYFSFDGKNGTAAETKKKIVYSPLLGYYHKKGWGISGTGSLVNDGDAMNFYQAAITPSYDYLENRKFAAGISYTRYLTKDSLNFYTTPLKNEFYGYFMYRKAFIKPMIAISYGWGSRSDYEQREALINDLRLRRRGFIYINTEEKISDFSIVASIRHDFYWLDAFTYKDHIRFTPQLNFVSGTQKFGFNQFSSTYVTVIRNNSSVLYNSENIYLDDNLKFQPLSLSLMLRAEYFTGRFFIQPQFALDYYFPATNDRLSAVFAFNAGFIF